MSGCLLAIAMSGCLLAIAMSGCLLATAMLGCLLAIAMLGCEFVSVQSVQRGLAFVTLLLPIKERSSGIRG